MTKSDNFTKTTLGALMLLTTMLAPNTWAQSNAQPAIASKSFTGWVLSKPEWSPGDEANYEKYVA
ncbi:MAG: hypothetical protein EOP06_17235, partial [Proteobacteria bacterium]